MNQSRAVGVFTWIHLLAMYFLLRVWLRSKESWDQAMHWSLGVGFLVSLTAVFQNLLPEIWRGDLGQRFTGIIGNSAFFGAYMIPLIGISGLQFFETKTNRKWIFLCLALWFFVMVALSGSRGAFGGLLAGTFITLLSLCFLWFRSKNVIGNRRVLIGGLFIVLIVASGGIYFLQTSGATHRLFDFSFEQQTGQTRLMAWNIAWKAFLDRPILGWGFGNYEVPFNKYYNPQFFQYGFQETVWDKPHNGFLEMLSSMGVFSIFYVALFVVSVVLLLLKKNNQSPEEKRRNSILGSTLVAYAVTVSILFDTIAALFLMVFLFSYISYSISGGTKKEYFLREYSFILKGIFVVGVLYCMMLNVQFLRSSIALKQSLDHTNLFGFSQTVDTVFSSSTALEDENALMLADQLTKMEKANMLGSANSLYWKGPALKITEVLDSYALRYPDNLSYRMWSAEVNIILGQYVDLNYYKKAVDLLHLAQQIAPQKQEVKILLARTFLLQKDFENAVVVSQQAVDDAPNIGHSYFFLGLTQESSGKRSEAILSFGKALELGYYPTENERQLYFDILAAEKQYTKLGGEYLRLIQDDSQNYNLYVKLATVYALDGKKKESLEMVEKAVVLYPPLREEADNFIKQNNLR